MKTREELKKEFFEEINKIKRYDLKDQEESPVELFGYRVRKGDETFTVTDYGNIYKWIIQNYVSKDEVKETYSKILETRLNMLFELENEGIADENMDAEKAILFAKRYRELENELRLLESKLLNSDKEQP